MSRDHFFCGLLILALANGLALSVVGAVVGHGWSTALLNTFNTSAVVWFACFAALGLLYRSKTDEVITVSDAAIGVGILLMTIVPSAKFSWLALTVLSLYMLSIAPARSLRQRGALIALAATGPMLWGPALMEIFGTQILQADAILVSTLIGTARVGTMFSGAIGANGLPTHFMIGPPCSSLHGISIAILAWVTISNAFGSAWSARLLVCGLLAVISVLAVNVLRMSLVGLFPAYYPSIHGSPGSEIAAWLSLALVVAIPLLGISRETLRT
jgi:exosortase/archaeosortase family protein